MCSMNWSKPSPAPWPQSSGQPGRRPLRLKQCLRRGKNGSRILVMPLKSVVQVGPQRPPQVWNRSHRKRRLRAESPSAAVGSGAGGPSLRAIGHAYHFVDLERGVRRNSKLIAGDIQAQIDTIRAIAQQEHLSQTCLDRIEKAERVVPKMQATIEFVSGYVRQQVSQMALAPPVSYAMHASLIPSFYLDRVAQTRTVSGGEPLRALAHHLRTPLFVPGGVFAELSPTEQIQLKQQAQTLAEVFQRSSSNVEGRNGYLSLRNHQLRGLGHPESENV